MRSLLRKCKVCGRYSLKDLCLCGNETSVPIPPRFSPQDRYGEYRRRLKDINKKESNVKE
ncbi:MAG: RNA-protein complex protein Nop10 [Thermoplasmata archaeon]|nr:MAG: RNA-protein complex protein Nop10 [Thermoplasmata archaeon]